MEKTEAEEMIKNGPGASFEGCFNYRSARDFLEGHKKGAALVLAEAEKLERALIFLQQSSEDPEVHVGIARTLSQWKKFKEKI